MEREETYLTALRMKVEIEGVVVLLIVEEGNLVANHSEEVKVVVVDASEEIETKSHCQKTLPQDKTLLTDSWRLTS